ncbi:MAG: hypothetical protein LC659_14030 [Myxococcales bacterium]|nr:hypothetical protein [Myxococcales bacterium]
MRVRVEAVVAARGVVFARPLEPGPLLASARATLGGHRVAHFDLPRTLRPDGTPDLELIGFQLESAADATHFTVGAEVVYRDE